AEPARADREPDELAAGVGDQPLPLALAGEQIVLAQAVPERLLHEQQLRGRARRDAALVELPHPALVAEEPAPVHEAVGAADRLTAGADAEERDPPVADAALDQLPVEVPEAVAREHAGEAAA